MFFIRNFHGQSQYDVLHWLYKQYSDKKFMIYCTSHMQITRQIMDIIPECFHVWYLYRTMVQHIHIRVTCINSKWPVVASIISLY